MQTAVRVQSVDEEDHLMGACSCSGSWVPAREVVAPFRGGWLDFLTVRCAACGSVRLFTFDITGFFLPRPGVWSGRPWLRASGTSGSMPVVV